MRSHSTLTAGEWVEVRSQEEILATLDGRSQLDGLPFMPEMTRFCGQRFKVYKRAHRTCDTVDYVGGRGMERTVHLEGLRCDGAGHGACQALCLLFWKEAWLRRVDGGPVATVPGATGGTPEGIVLGTRAAGEAADHPDPTWVCQATRLLDASVPLRKSDLAPYFEDLASRNVSARQMAGMLAFAAYEFLVGGRYGLSTPLTFLYDTVARWTGGTPYPHRPGKIPKGQKTPVRRLDLQPGELVRVRTLPEIVETIDQNGRNRGMVFHTEMVQFTGRTYRVLRRVEHIVNEKTGKMIHLKNDAVILEDVVCKSRVIDNCRRFCPRSVYLYFREIWLERVEAAPGAAGDGEPRRAAGGGR
jgi:hypothetical protein